MFVDDTIFFYPVKILTHFIKNSKKKLKRLMAGSLHISHPKIVKLNFFPKNQSRVIYLLNLTDL